MPAQLGSAVTLAYGPQGSQQNSASLVLASTLPARSFVLKRLHGQWTEAAIERTNFDSSFPPTETQDTERGAPWGEGAPLMSHDASTWGVSAPTDRAEVAPWSRYEGHPQPESDATWGVSTPRDHVDASPWGRYGAVAQPESLAYWLKAIPADVRDAAPWGRYALRIALDEHAVFGTSVPRDMEQWVPWTRFSRVLAPGWGIVIPIQSPDDPPEALYVIPIKRVYMPVNSSSLRRVDGDVALPTFGMSLSIDYQSWAWTLNATLPATALSDVEPNSDGDPVELEATVNGISFRLLAERIARDRTFGNSRITVGGRSKAALLDAPYAQILNFGNTDARNAQQLANDVLMINGVPLGWDVTWNAVDWLVPAGAFSFQGSHMTALNSIVASAGSYLQPHPTDQTLIVLPLYPVAPWNWDSVDPDYELPAAVMTREGIEWVEKPRYNRVFVSGVKTGVLGQVTRAGTDGGIVAPMITDALITHADAARQRGIPVLADTGRIATVSLRMPVLTDYEAGGIVTPGKFVRYIDGDTIRIGLTRSTALDVSTPEVWQTIEVETHA